MFSDLPTSVRQYYFDLREEMWFARFYEPMVHSQRFLLIGGAFSPSIQSRFARSHQILQPHQSFQVSNSIFASI